MIYSKFGTKLTLQTKSQNIAGLISIQATPENATDVRQYSIADLKADEGFIEINEAIAKLPWKVIENKRP
jgi:uncharacterized protein YecA (UPF0149 family)